MKTGCTEGAYNNMILKKNTFLAVNFWVAQYILIIDTKKGHKMIDELLQFSTALGFFPEEIDPVTGELLGNILQSFVHAAFIGDMHDLNERLK